jgi:hypothetical protein
MASGNQNLNCVRGYISYVLLMLQPTGYASVQRPGQALTAHRTGSHPIAPGHNSRRSKWRNAHRLIEASHVNSNSCFGGIIAIYTWNLTSTSAGDRALLTITAATDITRHRPISRNANGVLAGLAESAGELAAHKEALITIPKVTRSKGIASAGDIDKGLITAAASAAGASAARASAARASAAGAFTARASTVRASGTTTASWTTRKSLDSDGEERKESV